MKFGDEHTAELYAREVAALVATLGENELAVAPRQEVRGTRRGTLGQGERLTRADLLPVVAEDGTVLQSAYERCSSLLARGVLVESR